MADADQKYYFEFFTDEAQQHRWSLKSANGEIMATGESHADHSDAVRAARTVMGAAAWIQRASLYVSKEDAERMFFRQRKVD